MHRLPSFKMQVQRPCLGTTTEEQRKQLSNWQGSFSTWEGSLREPQSLTSGSASLCCCGLSRCDANCLQATASKFSFAKVNVGYGGKIRVTRISKNHLLCWSKTLCSMPSTPFLGPPTKGIQGLEMKAAAFHLTDGQLTFHLKSLAADGLMSFNNKPFLLFPTIWGPIHIRKIK